MRQYAPGKPGYAHPMQEQFARFLEQTGDAGRLFCVFQTRTIVATALLEGTAFFALISYMIGRSPVALALAIVMMVAVAGHFPTRAGVIGWIEDQLHRLERERQYGR